MTRAREAHRTAIYANRGRFEGMLGLRALVDEMADEGVAPRILLANTGIDPDALAEPSLALLPDQKLRIFENARSQQNIATLPCGRASGNGSAILAFTAMPWPAVPPSGMQSNCVSVTCHLPDRCLTSALPPRDRTEFCAVTRQGAGEICCRSLQNFGAPQCTHYLAKFWNGIFPARRCCSPTRHPATGANTSACSAAPYSSGRM